MRFRETTLSGSEVEACCDEISSLCVVKECQELESTFSLKATEMGRLYSP